MKLFGTIICLLAVPFICLSQSPSEPRLIDQQGQPNCETLLVGVDILSNYLREDPNTRGAIVVSGPADQLIWKLNYELLVRGAIVQRGADASRIDVIRGGETSQITLSHWHLPPGVTMPESSRRQWNLRFPRGSKAFVIHSDMEQICSTPTFPALIKEIADLNPSIRIHVVVYGDSQRVRRKGIREVNAILGNHVKSRIRFFPRRPPDYTPDFWAEYWLVPEESK